MTQGILYIATSDSYLLEAERSAQRTDAVLDLPISIISHREPDSDVFDEVIIDKSPTNSVADKSRNLLKSPYEETIFLDSDTYVVQDISNLFLMVNDSTPLAITLDPHEGSLYDQGKLDIPNSFPEYQTGVIVYKKTKDVQDFIQRWQNNHEPLDSPDQLSIRKTLFESEFDINIFPLRYNALIGTSIYGPVMVLHDFPRILSNYNMDKVDRILDNINHDDDSIRTLNGFHFRYIPEKPLSWSLPLRVCLAGFQRGYQAIFPI